MTAPFHVPVFVDGDAEPVVIPVRDRITTDLIRALPTGYHVPVLDLPRGRWVCLHLAASPANPWRCNRGHEIAELDLRPGPFEPWREPVVVNDDDIRGLVEAGPCDFPVMDAPPEARAEAERLARRRAAQRRQGW